jgi:hypothetical protein
MRQPAAKRRRKFMHTESHPLAGKTVTLETGGDKLQGQVVTGAHFRIEDWWDHLTGKSWSVSAGNPAAMHYGFRAGNNHLPSDDEVVYGKIGAFGHLVHVSELRDEVTT